MLELGSSQVWGSAVTSYSLWRLVTGQYFESIQHKMSFDMLDMGNSWYCAHKYPPLAFDNRGNWQIWALQSNLMAEYKRKIKATGGVIISKLNFRQ